MMNNQYKIEKIKRKVDRYLDTERFEHTVGVMYTASALAMCHRVDLDKSLVAGLLHDCAKAIPSEKKIKLCEKYDIPISHSERENPGLLHAKLGAYLAKKKYDIEDEEILDAITYHTTGRPGMSPLEKIIYIADYIEPNRNAAPNLPAARALAFQNLNECLYLILKDSLEYLKTKNDPIDPMTEKTYLYYKKRLNKS